MNEDSTGCLIEGIANRVGVIDRSRRQVGRSMIVDIEDDAVVTGRQIRELSEKGIKRSLLAAEMACRTGLTECLSQRA